jgi:hypothetical protein
MDENTEIMYEAAEALYQEIGERHGYSGVCAGVYAVLEKRSRLFPGTIRLPSRGRWYFSTRFHYPLAEFHSSFAEGKTSFTEVAQAIDAGFFGMGRRPTIPSLPSPFDRIAEGHWPYELSGARADYRLISAYADSETQKYLKEHKIRRNTKKAADFYAENAQKVFDTVAARAREAVEGTRQKIAGIVDGLRALEAQAQEMWGGLDFDDSVRRTLLELAGLPTETPTSFSVLNGRLQIDRVIKDIREHAEYVRSSGEVTSDDVAVAQMNASPVLRPFLAALGIAVGRT